MMDKIQWTGDNIEKVLGFMGDNPPSYLPEYFSNRDDILMINTSDGLIAANKGDWITKNGQGEFHVERKGEE